MRFISEQLLKVAKLTNTTDEIIASEPLPDTAKRLGVDLPMLVNLIRNNKQALLFRLLPKGDYELIVNPTIYGRLLHLLDSIENTKYTIVSFVKDILLKHKTTTTPDKRKIKKLEKQELKTLLLQNIEEEKYIDAAVNIYNILKKGDA